MIGDRVGDYGLRIFFAVVNGSEIRSAYLSSIASSAYGIN